MSTTKAASTKTTARAAGKAASRVTPKRMEAKKENIERAGKAEAETKSSPATASGAATGSDVAAKEGRPESAQQPAATATTAAGGEAAKARAIGASADAVTAAPATAASQAQAKKSTASDARAAGAAAMRTRSAGPSKATTTTRATARTGGKSKGATQARVGGGAGAAKIAEATGGISGSNPMLQTLERAVDIGRGNVAAVLESQRAAAQALAEVGSRMVGLSRAGLEEGLTAARALARCRTLGELVAAQAELSKDSTERLVKETAALSAIFARAMRESMRPLTTHLAATVELMVPTRR